MQGHVYRSARIAVLSAALGLAGCGMRAAPLGPGDTAQYVADIRTALAFESEPLVRPLDLHEALARALKYNQELKAEAMARLMGEADLALRSAEMLPQLVASSQAYQRSNSSASFSRQLASGASSGLYSESSERLSRTGDLTFSWNILDFGVSYFRARQAGDRSLIAAEQHRKVAARIIEETRTAFWRAAALQRLDQGLRALDQEMSGALANAARLSAAGLTEPGEALGAQRDLLAIRRDIDVHKRSLVGAEDQLRALINLSPVEPLRLVIHGTDPIPAPGRLSFEELATIALANRPDIRQSVYEQRITAEDARIALLELFPGLNLVLGASLDQNPFLLHQGWTSVAARASWQLVKLLQYPARSSLIETKGELDRQRSRALAVAAILQGQVAILRLRHAQDEHRTLNQLAMVQRQLARHSENQQRVGRVGTQAMTRERMSALLSESRRDAAYGEVQAAYAGVLTALGQDAMDLGQAAALPLADLASWLRQAEKAAFATRPGAGAHRPARIAAADGAGR